MKTILLSGSPRRGGNTDQVLGVIAETLNARGIETEIIPVPGNIESCRACGACKRKPGRCVINDGLNEIMDKLREAQGLVVGAPVYFGTARGAVMSALQRIGNVSRSGEDFLSGMVGGPVAVARRGGHTLTLQEMMMFFQICGLIVPGSTYWNMVFGRDPGECMEDEEGIKTAQNFAENMAKVMLALDAAEK